MVSEPEPGVFTANLLGPDISYEGIAIAKRLGVWELHGLTF